MSGGGIANPAPLGLFAFGITTLLLSFDNSGISSPKMLNLVLAHALFYGGAAQFATGMWEFASGSVFGATVFSTFGAFWVTFAVFIWAHEGGLFKMATDVDLTIFFLVWATFVAMLTVITSRISKVHCFLFGSVAVVLYLLAIGEWVPAMHKLGGCLGLISGVTALYLGYATLINEVWKGEFLPIGVIKPKGAAEAEAKLELDA